MERQVLSLLQATTVPNTEIIKRAEADLISLYPQQDFPFALLTIATHAEIEPSSRKAALTALRNYVNSTWSVSFEESTGVQIDLTADARTRIRSQVLAICTTADAGNDANQSLAASVLSKIASADFPDQWPELFPSLLSVLTSTTGSPVLGALRVLHELVDSGLDENQFFAVARDLVNALQHVAMSGGNEPIVQAMAVNVLHSCFEMLEQVLETDHATAVKAFLDESMKAWIQYLLRVLREPLPEVTATDFEEGAGIVVNKWKGIVALKIQTVKLLQKIKAVYIASISAHVFELFQVMWHELSNLHGPYTKLFIDRDSEGKRVDSNSLPYTLDVLLIEDLDFLQSALKAKSVRAELQKQAPSLATAPWLQELLHILVSYSRIPQEEENIWKFDANIYLSETTSVTANYTPRAACADLLVRSAMEWLKQIPIQALVFYNQQQSSADWRDREALLFLLNQGLKDLDETQLELDKDTAAAILQQTSAYVQDSNEFLRAAAHLTLGTLFTVSGQENADAASTSFALAIKAINEDQSHIVSVCSLTTIPQYISALPRSVTVPLQISIIDAINNFLLQHDLASDLEDSDDVKSALIIALRDAMMLDTSHLEQTPALDLFFNLASDGASNFMLAQMLVEAFESIVSSVAEHGDEAYIKLCEKTIPSLSGAFHIADMRQESELTNLAAELVSALAEFGKDPLPDGFISAVMPQLHRVLMEATEASLVRPATQAVTHMLNKGSTQFLAWSHDGKSSIELTLVIINRLLNSSDVEEAAADQVGSLAASLVDKCGAERLGTYLSDLLRAVAVRLASAQRVQFIQSLLMVFVSLAIKVPNDVVTFLAEVDIQGTNGLQVVLTKWLENSVHFAGFDEIRQNAVALSKIYGLHDERVSAVQVKGDLIINETGRIKTRSQARLNPDTWTSIPADLKILKLLIDELKNAATSRFADFGAAQAAADAADDADSLASDDGGDDWEDEPDSGAIDLGSEKVRNHLMGLVGEGAASPTGSRFRDDETADFLASWFKTESARPEFETSFVQLKPEEQATLRDLVQ